MMNSTTETKNGILKKLLIGIGVTAFWLAVWQLLAMLINKQVVLSPPLTVLKTLVSLAATGEFWLTVGMSAARIFAGFALGVLFGVLLALMTSVSRAARAIFSPMMSAIKATPVASFIIMLLFFSENGKIPTVICFLMVLPLVWANTFKGIAETDVKLLEMAQVYGLSRRSRLKDIYIPSVRPYFVPAALTSLGFAWKAGIAAEVLAAPEHSVGGMLYRAKVYLETPEMLAWTLCVIVISILLEWGLKHLLKARGEGGYADGKA